MATCPYCSAPLSESFRPRGMAVLQGCRKCLNPFVARGIGPILETARLTGVADIRQTAPPGSVMEGVLKTFNRMVETLPALPEIPQRVIGMIHDPLTTMTELANIIDEDPAISMRVLKLANSALYAGTREVKDLNLACSRLGLRTIGNVAHTVASASLYRTGHKKFRDLMEGYWRHAVATAHCADELATCLKQDMGGTAFVSGLVHNIGKPVLLDIITVKHRGPVGQLLESAELLGKVIEEYHALVGLHVVQHWDMAPEFAVSTYCHGQPSRTPAPELLPLAHVVNLACDVTTAIGYGPPAPEPVMLENHPSAAYFGMNNEAVTEFAAALPAQLDPVLDALSYV